MSFANEVFGNQAVNPTWLQRDDCWHPVCPPFCPPGCQGGFHTVRPGETVWSIARQFDVSVHALERCNPTICRFGLFPGQVLCLPNRPCPPRPPRDCRFDGCHDHGHDHHPWGCHPGPFPPHPHPPRPRPPFPPSGPFPPCCVVLRPTRFDGRRNPHGVAFVNLERDFGFRVGAITVAAHDLPDPRRLGNFDAYEAIVFSRGFSRRWRLFPTPERPTTWAGTLRESLRDLARDGTIQVRPVNTRSGRSGPPILQGSLADCGRRGWDDEGDDGWEAFD